MKRVLMKAGGVVACALAVAGCGGSQDFADIEQFMAEVESRPASPIPPLPPFEQVEPFAYQASTKRQPFEPPVKVTALERRPDGVQVKPNFDRVRQYLEQFPIGQLTMVGTLSQSSAQYALIQDPEGGVHRVRIGDYIGTDHGKIQMISDLDVQLVEIVPDGTGGWVERARTVALGGDDA